MHTYDVQWHNTFPITAIPGLGYSLSDVVLKLRAELNKSPSSSLAQYIPPGSTCLPRNMLAKRQNTCKVYRYFWLYVVKYMFKNTRANFSGHAHRVSDRCPAPERERKSASARERARERARARAREREREREREKGVQARQRDRDFPLYDTWHCLTPHPPAHPSPPTPLKIRGDLIDGP
jgi:hypothetical protein